jgi:general secretion pathway protein B
MSYILEALKKAEQARNRGKAPELFTVQTVQAALPKPRNPWPYIIVAVLAINAAVLLAWLRPWHRATPPATPSVASASVDPQPAQPILPPAPTSALLPAPTASAPAERLPNATPATVEGGATPATPRPISPSSAKTAKPSKSSEPKSAEAKLAAKAPSPQAAREPARKEGSQSKSAASASPAPAAAEAGDASEAGVITFNELPADIRQELANITVAVHMYSAKPADRFVGVNDRAVREGEELNPGLKLEKITYDGMILSYKGYRFRKGLN